MVSSPGKEETNERLDEASVLVNALMSSPYPAENDEISGFYSEVKQQNERGIGSASEWFDSITSNK